MIAVVCIVCIVLYANSGDQRSEVRRDSVQVIVFPILKMMLLVGVVGFVILIIKFAIKSAIQEAGGPAQVRNSSAPSPPGFPIPGTALGIPISADGPGQYRIQGVHRGTKMDVSRYIQADSAANARVKAELEDIVVTLIQKVTV